MCDAKPRPRQKSRAKTVEEQYEWGILPGDTQRQMPKMQQAQHIKVANLVKILSGAVHRRVCQGSQ